MESDDNDQATLEVKRDSSPLERVEYLYGIVPSPRLATNFCAAGGDFIAR